MLTLLPNKNVRVTVVVNCVWMNITRYIKSGLAGNGSWRNILEHSKNIDFCYFH